MSAQETIDAKPRRVADIPEDLGPSIQKLTEYGAQIGIELTEDQAHGLVSFLALVLKKNEILNLTAIREWEKGLILHLVDSLIILPEFDDLGEAEQERPYLDMGCGAGFPGIPLALVRPERKGVLCDSVKKKIVAVDEFIGDLGLGSQLSTTTERLESLGHTNRRQFGCITARALASLPVLVEYATPLLSKRGRFIAVKGRPAAEELESGRKAAEICGLVVRSVRTMELPFENGERTIIVYEKVAEPSISLPRQVGEATKQPLA